MRYIIAYIERLQAWSMRAAYDDDAIAMRIVQPHNRYTTHTTGVPSPVVWTTARMIVRGMFVLLLLRFFVLVAEARAMILSERSADDELVHLCALGTARESAHMRAACMQATVDRASPAMARALTRGAYAFASELYMLLSEPFKACSLLGAVGALSMLPWIGTLWQVCTIGALGGDGREGGSHDRDHTVVILRNGEPVWSPGVPSHQLLKHRNGAKSKLAYDSCNAGSDRIVDLPS